MWSSTSGGEPHSRHIWYLTGRCNTKGKFKRLFSSGPVPGLTMISAVFSSTFCCHFRWNQSLVSPGLAEDGPPPSFILQNLQHQKPVAVHEWQALLFATTCSSCCAPYDFNDTWKTDQFNQEDIFTSVLWSLYVHNCLQNFPPEERFLNVYEDPFPLVVLRSDSHLSEKKWSEKNDKWFNRTGIT